MSAVEINWLYRGETLSLTTWTCRRHDAGLSEETAQRGYVIAIPHAGVFVRYSAGGRIIADTNHVVFFNEGEPYQTAHPYGCGDRGATIFLPRETAREMIAAIHPRVGNREQNLFEFQAALIDSRLFFEQSILFASLARGECDALEIEERALRLADRLIRRGAAHQATSPRTTGRRASTRRVHRDLAQCAAGTLSARFAECWTLAALAREVHSSPYHLARIFRAATGLTIHAYLTRARLRASLERLRETDQSLAQIALACGFSSQSHFTTAFRRTFGCTPAALRSLTSTIVKDADCSMRQNRHCPLIAL